VAWSTVGQIIERVVSHGTTMRELHARLHLPRHLAVVTAPSSAELRRAVARYQEIAAQTVRATLEERPLREALASLSSLRDERLRVVEATRPPPILAGASRHCRRPVGFRRPDL